MSTTVTSAVKPPQVVAPAEATVQAQHATYDEVVEAGLTALREAPHRLYGYGIRGMRRPAEGATLSGTFTVYADRD